MTLPSVRLSVPARLFQVLAVSANVVLVLMPMFYLFSGSRVALPYFIISGSCIVLATVSSIALLSRFLERVLFVGTIVINGLVLALIAFLFSAAAIIRQPSATDYWTLILMVPAVLNLVAVVLVHRTRVRGTDAVAA